jgi:hypothetical protein
VSDMSFVIKYRRLKTIPACDGQCEKYCPSQAAALTFCVVLRNLGGEAIELVQLIQGREDAVLDGRALDEAIDRQRTRIEQDANPPWR